MNRAIAPAFFAAALLAACGGAPVSSAPIAPVTIAVPPAPIAEETPPPTAAEPSNPLPPSIDFPESAACVLEATSWRNRGGGTELLFRADGPAFAEVYGGQARLHFPVGLRQATQLLSVTDGGLAVRGHIDPGSVDLWAERPFVFNGFVSPTVATLLRWVDGSDGQLGVSIDPPAGVEVLAPPLLATRPCADFSIRGSGSFEAEASITGDKKTRPMQLPLGKPIELATSAGGPPVARLTAPAGEVRVDVFDVRGSFSRIVWRRATIVVFGWVASRALLPPTSGVGYGSGLDGLGGGKLRETALAVVCAADVPLVAEAEGERATVGSIAAGTIIRMLEHAGAYMVIRVQSNIVVADGASFLVRNADLAGCSPAA